MHVWVLVWESVPTCPSSCGCVQAYVHAHLSVQHVCVLVQGGVCTCGHSQSRWAASALLLRPSRLSCSPVALSAQGPAWLQKESTEEAAMTPGGLATCPQVSWKSLLFFLLCLLVPSPCLELLNPAGRVFRLPGTGPLVVGEQRPHLLDPKVRDKDFQASCCFILNHLFTFGCSGSL